jgi:hypothetical protein
MPFCTGLIIPRKSKNGIDKTKICQIIGQVCRVSQFRTNQKLSNDFSLRMNYNSRRKTARSIK